MKVGSIGALRSAWVVIAVLFVLTACGGGGGGGSTPPPPPPPPFPTATLSVASAIIVEGESTELTWTSTNATTCAAFGGWSGDVATSGSRSTGALTTTTTFHLSCTGAGGSANRQVTVFVNPIPPTISLTATPPVVRDAQTSTLTWTSVKVTSCEASAGWSGSRPSSGSETVGPFGQQAGLHVYSLTCATTTGPNVSNTVLVQHRTGVNQPPVANAGADRDAGATQVVQLNSSSHDDGGLASFAWRQTAGIPVTLEPGITESGRSFTAPIVQTATALTFELIVTDDEGLVSAPDFVTITVQPIPPTVTISGDVQYERVPLVPLGAGWSYANQNYEVISNVLVEVLNAGTQTVVASGTFPGNFQLTVPSQTDLALRATARTARQAPQSLPHWEISVRDLDADGAPLSEVYSYTGPTFNSHAGGQFSLRIPSGWNSTGQQVGPRAAAPFAILGTLQLMLSRPLFPQPDLPPLTIDWSPTNTGGQTFYSTRGGAHRIVLSGEVDVDTDEYDTAVILHEMSHFMLNTVSRDESLGGSHAFGDRLDMRVAYSEGFATVFGAFASGQTVYEDSFGPGQRDSSFFSVEQDQTLNEGWFSEFSIQEILWDFGSSSLWQALHAPMQETDAMASGFPLFSALKEIDPSRAGDLSSLLANELIVGATIDDFGSTETNNAGSADVLPIYTPIALGGTVQLRSTNEFGTGNKLGNHRYLRLSLAATTNVRFQVSAAADKDADIAIYRRGVSLGPDQGPANEDFSLTLDAGEYVLDVYECGNADCNDSVTPGPTDITVSVSAN